MSRCLSERTLLRLVAGSGLERQRAHLRQCDECTLRHRAIVSDLDRVSDVLLHTEPPHWSPPFLARYWLPAAGAAVAAIALLVWVEITVWRAVTPAQPEEVTAFLSDVSAAMFSTRDALAASDTGSGTTADDGLSIGCPSDPLGILGCESDTENDQSAGSHPGR